MSNILEIAKSPYTEVLPICTTLQLGFQLSAFSYQAKILQTFLIFKGLISN